MHTVKRERLVTNKSFQLNMTDIIERRTIRRNAGALVQVAGFRLYGNRGPSKKMVCDRTVMPVIKIESANVNAVGYLDWLDLFAVLQFHGISANLILPDCGLGQQQLVDTDFEDLIHASSVKSKMI
jgi:hypothetical protein